MPTSFGADNTGEEAVKGPLDRNESAGISVSTFPFQLTFQAGVGERSKGEKQDLLGRGEKGSWESRN